MNRDGCLSILLATAFFVIFLILVPLSVGLTVQYYKTEPQTEVATEEN